MLKTAQCFKKVAVSRSMTHLSQRAHLSNFIAIMTKLMITTTTVMALAHKLAKQLLSATKSFGQAQMALKLRFSLVTMDAFICLNMTSLITL